MTPWLREKLGKKKRGKIAKLKHKEAPALGAVTRENDPEILLDNMALKNTLPMPEINRARKHVFGSTKPEIANVTKPKNIWFLQSGGTKNTLVQLRSQKTR